MAFSSFLFPENIVDIPRLFTAIAEWCAVFIYSLILKKRLSKVMTAVVEITSLLIMIAFQFVAGLLPLGFWIPMMVGAVVLMFMNMFLVLDIKPTLSWVLTIHAFVLAEFAASLYRQIYIWHVGITGQDRFSWSFIIMAVFYAATFYVYYRVEKGSYFDNNGAAVTAKDLISVVATGIGAFIISNVSFVWNDSPFSVPDSVSYVRTLVDFGGLLMLQTQMERRNELSFRSENDEINKLFRKQYEQYKLAIDNSELLRKEMHDMKHYVAALKNEDDPVKRAEVLADMEQVIAVQESFMNTGNKVLDVILTTKSLQCQKQKITLNAMVDGDILTEIHVKDICSLFGNILDNAIEATQQVTELDKRLITLSVKKHNQFILVECENYSETPVEMEKTRPFPGTSKKDTVRHGFGLKSIQKVAEKYGGAMTINYEGGWFKVKVLLSSSYI